MFINILITFFFLFGLCVGSFLNVVIYRLPKTGMSIIRPGSHCPICLEHIRWYDNIPLLSYCLLGQCCRICKSYISMRYPLVELLTGLVFGYVAWFGLGISGPGVFEVSGLFESVVKCSFAAALIAVTFIDIDLRIIPDEISWGGMAAAVLLSIAVPSIHAGFSIDPVLGMLPWKMQLGDYGPRVSSFFASVFGIIVGMGLVGGIRILGRLLFRKEAMGMGDVKLMGLIGGIAGWDGVIATVVIASFAGMVFGIANLVVNRDKYMPFGPFLAIGAFFVAVHKTAMIGFITRTYPDWFFNTFFK
ncbi:prepilin peptidase [Planctomycetota bacterium]